MNSNNLNFEDIRNQLLKGPRVNVLMDHFEDIASAKNQIPTQKVEPLETFLESAENQKYYRIFKRNMGAFFHHAVASIPFVLEEHCRVNIAVSSFAKELFKEKQIKEPFTLYELSAADGTNARSLAEYSEGLIRTLTDTPNQANGVNFHKLCSHKFSQIYIGSFADITPDYLCSREDLFNFHNGFDVILEPLAFQMYGKNRMQQIAYAKRLLKDKGIFIMMEKILHPDEQEYMRREELKDVCFKRHYFDLDQIKEKKQNILLDMRSGQVSLDDLLASINSNFKHAWLIWNSANFYEIVASDSLDRLEKFISLLDDPYVPDKFVCDKHLVMKPVI